MLSPGDPPFRNRLQRAYAIAVYEIEVLRFDPGKQPTSVRRLDPVPSHVRQSLGVQPLHQPWPDATALGSYTMFDARLEEHLVTNADGQCRPPTCQALGNDLWPFDRSQACHASRECADAGNDQPIRSRSEPGIAAHGDVCASAGDRTLSGANVARAVVQYDNAPHNAPLLLGTPVTRASKATASLSARARALNWHSTMWCGSRPDNTV